MSELTTEYDPKSPIGTFDLPAGVLVKDSQGKARLLDRIRMREITGREEDIIASEKMGFTARMISVVAGCTEALIDKDGNELDDEKKVARMARRLTIADLMACLFYARILSVGTEFKQSVVCPYHLCDAGGGKPYSWTARFNLLDDFPVLKCKVDPTNEVHEYTSSKRGTVVTWSLMTGEARMKFESNPTTNERATAALMMRVRTVNGEPATKEVLQSLGMMDRREIRDYMIEQEGGIDTTFDAECKNCGHEFKAELEMRGFNFFVPSETLED